MKLNRKEPPSSSPIGRLSLSQPGKIMLGSGLPLYYVKGNDDEVLRLDFVFRAGVRFQPAGAVAPATSALLSEGTNSRSSREVADAFDFYGSYFQARCYADDAVVTLYCLKKHLRPCLMVMNEVLNEAAFPEHELEIYRKNAIQQLKVNEKKTSFLARRQLNKLLFGDASPYGKSSTSDDYAKISRENLAGFFKDHYLRGLKYVIASGWIDDDVLKHLEDSLALKVPAASIQGNTIVQPSEQKSSNIHVPQAVQCTLRLGTKLFNRVHPDYQKLQVLNMVLGGYFGSRLMKSIREEKGLTYGIYSSLESYADTGLFYIETEVNNDLKDTAQDAIATEIQLLRNELIDETELSLARNYMLGSFLRSMDGPFSLADKYKITIDFNTGTDYYDRFVDTVRGVSAVELRELAQRYFDPGMFYTVTAGHQLE